MKLREVRERVNLSLYESKARNLKILRVLNLFISVSALIVLAIYYGFPQTEGSSYGLLSFIKFSFDLM